MHAWLTVGLDSPEDHAILEAEYQRNPKPDKTARADIVNRVSLGEKEVQVGFFRYNCMVGICSNATSDLVPEPPPE